MINLQHIKQQWISALRSGKYNQTRQILHDETGYCCLGVLLCVLYKEGLNDFGTVQIEPQAKMQHFVIYEDEETEFWAPWEDEELPSDLINQLKITFDQQALLIKMNDGGEHGFDSIASYIEESSIMTEQRYVD